MVRIAAFVIVLLVSGSAWGQLDSCLEDLVRLTAERRISMADANGGDDIENAPHDGTEVILFWPAIGALPSMRRIGMWLPRTYGTCFLR